MLIIPESQMLNNVFDASCNAILVDYRLYSVEVKPNLI